MNIDDLNRRVTWAIMQAEALEAGSLEAQRAFRHVADLEEEIATIKGADTVEGEIARLGAVTSSMSAGDSMRAVRLAERYLADALSPRVCARLRELREEAEKAVDMAATLRIAR